MSWSFKSSNPKNKKNQKYQEKSVPSTHQNTEPKLKGNTKYIPLVPEDAIYRENLFRLSNHEFQHALQKISKDLNSLLYYNEENFFQELETSDSLRVCLQSCLVCLCKNSCYNLCSTKILEQNRQKIDFPNEFFMLYEKLNEIVFKIYFRIVNTENKSHKQIIYNSWLLDIPKMIDFCMIYCIRTDSGNHFTNLELVTDVISKAILSNPQSYFRDFEDFINILYEDKLPLIHKDIRFLINLGPQAMEKANKNFADPLRSFLVTSNKILFEIKDLFTLISYVYRCFPKQLSQKLATDHQILEDSIRIFIEFVENTPLWKISPFEKLFQMNFQDIHRTACECFYLNFKIIRQIIERGDTLTNDYFSKAMTSYSVHCMYLVSAKVNCDYQKIYQRVITTILQNFEDQNLFFLREAPFKFNFLKLTEEQRACIQKSFTFTQKVWAKLQQIKEDRSLEMRIKEKIEQFFNKIQKPKVQQRIFFRNSHQTKKIKFLFENQRPDHKQKIDDSLSQLDFSALDEKNQKCQNDANTGELNLSFEQLKIDEEEEAEKQSNQFFKWKKQLQDSSKDLFEKEKIREFEQKQRIIYQQSLLIENQDQQEEIQSQKNTYYQYSKPQFGQFTDQLIEIEEWIPNPQEIFD